MPWGSVLYMNDLITPPSRDHRSSSKMGKRRPRAETQGHSQESMTEPGLQSRRDRLRSLCSESRGVVPATRPPPSVCVSAVLTLDP